MSRLRAAADEVPHPCCCSDQQAAPVLDGLTAPNRSRQASSAARSGHACSRHGTPCSTEYPVNPLKPCCSACGRAGRQCPARHNGGQQPPLPSSCLRRSPLPATRPAFEAPHIRLCLWMWPCSSLSMHCITCTEARLGALGDSVAHPALQGMRWPGMICPALTEAQGVPSCRRWAHV